jgi:outer membrane protein OmpA-like peptidoglycan-associated protein
MTNRNTKLFILAGLLLAGVPSIANAEANYHDVVIDSEGEIARNSYGNCIRSSQLTDRDLCPSENVVQQQTVQKTRQTTELTEEQRTVYFQFNRATLTPEAKQRLDTLVSALKSNQSIKEARIVGYADRIGSVSYNQQLSQKRAETVRDYLVANGYTNARVTDTRWVGKSEPTTNCPKEKRSLLIQCLHNDRKVAVEIEYNPENKISDAR